MNKAFTQIALVTSLTISLSACVDNGIKPDTAMALLLHQTIRIPAHSAQVTIQTGSVISDRSMDPYAPYCQLEMREQASHPRTIQPGTFTVERIKRDTEYVMKHPIQVAGPGFKSASSVSSEIFSTTFYLKSDSQPDVELITCEWWEDTALIGSRYLNMQQIKDTLAPLFTIER